MADKKVTGIPDKINAFNLYASVSDKKGDALVGISDEVTLPDFETLTETISGAGIAGEIDSPTIGFFGSMEFEVPFRMLDENALTLISKDGSVGLTLRGSQQVINKATGAITHKQIRIVQRGLLKKLATGKVKAGSPMEASVTSEILYILIEIDGTEKIKLDKLNFEYAVDGVDLLAKVKEQC